MPSAPRSAGSDRSDIAEHRLDDLEIKASFTDDLLDQLNMTIYRQQQQIDRLIVQVGQLRQQIPEGGAGGMGGAGGALDPRDELPPHY